MSLLQILTKFNYGHGSGRCNSMQTKRRKFVSRDVLDQVYKLYIRPNLDYGDITYHKYDPEMCSSFTQRLEQTQYSAELLLLVLGVQIGRGFMRN